jgi:hypothetical protein
MQALSKSSLSHIIALDIGEPKVMKAIVRSELMIHLSKARWSTPERVGVGDSLNDHKHSEVSSNLGKIIRNGRSNYLKKYCK